MKLSRILFLDDLNYARVIDFKKNSDGMLPWALCKNTILTP